MAYCRKCGMQYDGEQCKLCGGKPLPPPEDIYGQGGGLPLNAVNALCYLLGPITAVVFMMWPAHNQQRSVRFNALQSLLFFVLYMSVLFSASMFVPLAFREPVIRAVQITGIVCWLYVMWRTFQGDKVIIPLVGAVAEKNS